MNNYKIKTLKDEIERKLLITERRIAEYENSRPTRNRFMSDLEKLRFNDGYYSALDDIINAIEDLLK